MHATEPLLLKLHVPLEVTLLNMGLFGLQKDCMVVVIRLPYLKSVTHVP